MSTDYSRYLHTLFREGEFVCATNIPNGTSVDALDEVLRESPRAFVSLNPLDGSRDRFPTEDWHATERPRRADHNVTEHRNLLFEFDSGTIDEQMEFIVSRGVPYTSLVYSGGKSLHCVIALEEAVDRATYDELWQLVSFVLWKGDPTAKNPSRLTRAAGALRDNGKLQELVDLRKPVSRARLESWLSRFSAHIERCKAREAEQLARRAAKVTGGGFGSLSASTIRFLEGDNSGTKTSRHLRLVAITHELREAGLDYDLALKKIEAACEAHGITADPKRADEAAEIVNYVYGKRR